jgi:hypothetical protein
VDGDGDNVDMAGAVSERGSTVDEWRWAKGRDEGKDEDDDEDTVNDTIKDTVTGTTTRTRSRTG